MSFQNYNVEAPVPKVMALCDPDWSQPSGKAATQCDSVSDKGWESLMTALCSRRPALELSLPLNELLALRESNSYIVYTVLNWGFL